MKKVITPAKKEEAVYICDVTGIEMVAQSFLKDKPLVGSILALNNDYGAAWDSLSNNTLHLSEQVTKEVLEFLSQKYQSQRMSELVNY